MAARTGELSRNRLAFGAAAILVAPEAGIAGVAGGAVRLATHC